VDHIKEIVAMQQAYAKVAGVLEPVFLVELAESALKMQADSMARRDVTLVRQFEAVPPVTTDRHKVLQILVNLLSNARHACEQGTTHQREITLRVRPGAAGTVLIEVTDNGVGISSENLTRIFAHGFTTRKGGHGFGLHSAALAARELGGSLTVRSEGLGKGATFALTLPSTSGSSGDTTAQPGSEAAKQPV
jgi:signal transduction histidine kinase